MSNDIKETKQGNEFPCRICGAPAPMDVVDFCQDTESLSYCLAMLSVRSGHTRVTYQRISK